MEYQVALTDGTQLRVQTHPSLRFAVGDEVAVRLDTASATVFDTDTNEPNLAPVIPEAEPKARLSGTS
jgi:hypothetical protein